MTREEFITQRQDAQTWNAYASIYREYYRNVLAHSLCLGEPVFADTIHHTVFPDATGTVFGRVHWAVYSQPSASDIELVAPAIVDALEYDFRAARTHRYLFDAIGVTEEMARPVSRLVDVWYGDLAKILDLPPFAVVLSSIPILLSGCEMSYVCGPLADALATDNPSDLQGIIRHIVERSQASVVSPRFRSAVILSTIIIHACQGYSALSLLDQAVFPELAIASRIALFRARQSGQPEPLRLALEKFGAEVQPLVREYKIRTGDTLSRIVREFYGVPLSDIWYLIRELNPEIVDEHKIRAGRVLRLPEFGVDQEP